MEYVIDRELATRLGALSRRYKANCNLLINTYLLFYLITLTPTSHILHLYLTTYFVVTIISIPPLHTPTHQYC